MPKTAWALPLPGVGPKCNPQKGLEGLFIVSFSVIGRVYKETSQGGPKSPEPEVEGKILSVGRQDTKRSFPGNRN